MNSKQRRARRKLKSDIGQLTETATHCFKDGRILPGLVLLYATIDIVASLDRPVSKENADRKDFMSWVDAYVLRGSSLRSSATDLYAARCGLLHTYTPESRLSREGTAKEIYYAWGTGKAEDLEEAMNRSNLKTPTVAVHADELLRAVGRGFDKFFRDLSKDPRRAARVYDRAGKWFGGLSTELVEALRDSLDRGSLHPL
jgi:hypothetical protein